MLPQSSSTYVRTVHRRERGHVGNGRYECRPSLWAHIARCRVAYAPYWQTEYDGRPGGEVGARPPISGHEGLTRATAGDVHASMVLASSSSERSSVHSRRPGGGERDEVDDSGTDRGTIFPAALGYCGGGWRYRQCRAVVPCLVRSLLRR